VVPVVREHLDIIGDLIGGVAVSDHKRYGSPFKKEKVRDLFGQTDPKAIEDISKRKFRFDADVNVVLTNQPISPVKVDSSNRKMVSKLNRNLGVAQPYLGFALTRVIDDDPEQAGSTALHETLHTLGFVMPRSIKDTTSSRVKKISAHCPEETCFMAVKRQTEQSLCGDCESQITFNYPFSISMLRYNNKKW